MAAKRPTQSSAEVTPTDNGPTDGAVAATADPALAAPDSSAVPAETTDAAAQPREPAPVAPVAVAPAAPAQQVVYVEAPKPFVKKGNRGFGVLIALLSTVIFVVVDALARLVGQFVTHVTPLDFGFITKLEFYAPVIMFAVGFILLVLIVNRAGWAAHVLGSIFVGLVVWFGGTGVILLLRINQIPSNQVGQHFSAVLFSRALIIAALLGREVALWLGFMIASHGRKVKARNVDARVLYDQEIAAKRAEYEQANAAVATPAATTVEPVAVQPAETAEPAAEEPVAP